MSTLKFKRYFQSSGNGMNFIQQNERIYTMSVYRGILGSLSVYVTAHLKNSMKLILIKGLFDVNYLRTDFAKSEFFLFFPNV